MLSYLTNKPISQTSILLLNIEQNFHIMHRYRIYLITGITLTSIYMYIYINVSCVCLFIYISCISLMDFRGLDNGLYRGTNNYCERTGN